MFPVGGRPLEATLKMASREMSNGMADTMENAHTKSQKQNRNIFHIVTVGFLILAVVSNGPPKISFTYLLSICSLSHFPWM